MRMIFVVLLIALVGGTALGAADDCELTFCRVDRNSDGSLSRKEFMDGKVKISRDKAVKLFPGIHDARQLDERTLKENIFDKIDANHDGILSRNEWRRVAPNVLDIRF